MKNIIKVFLLFICILQTTCSTSSFSVRDFSNSGWRMYRGDVRNSGTAEGKIGSHIDLIWKFKSGGGIISTCLVTDQIVVVGGLDKKLYFLDPQTGLKLRILSFSGSIAGTPAIKDSLLFFGTQRGGDSFYALNLKNFKLVWVKRLRDISSSPIIHKEIVYVGAGDGSIRALQLKTGKEIWQFKTQDAIKASAAVDSNMLWLGSLDNYMYCISQNKGELLWKFKTAGGIYSTAAVDEENLYFGSADGSVYALDKNEGKKVWSFKTGAPVYSSPALSESLVFIGSNDHNLYALSKASGEKVWSFTCQSLIHSSPVIVGDKLVFGSLDGFFYVLDKENGALIFKYATEGMIKSSPAYYNGKFYLGSYDRHIYCWGN